MRNRDDVAEATELLPVVQVSEFAADVVFPVSIEEFDTPLATVLVRPLAAHVTSQAMELAVEAGRLVRFETFERCPDVIPIDRSAINRAATGRTAIIARGERGVRA